MGMGGPIGGPSGLAMGIAPNCRGAIWLGMGACGMGIMGRMVMGIVVVIMGPIVDTMVPMEDTMGIEETIGAIIRGASIMMPWGCGALIMWGCIMTGICGGPTDAGGGWLRTTFAFLSSS